MLHPNFGVRPDASALEVLAANSTSSRSLAARASDAFNVLDYGAKGDGVTDDANAIQAAIDNLSAGGGNVYMPAGNYLITKTIIIPSGCHLNGDGPGADWALIGISGLTEVNRTTLTWGGSGTDDMMSLPDETHDASLQGFRLDGNGIAGVSGLDLISCFSCTFRDLTIERIVTGVDWRTDSRESFFNRFDNIVIIDASDAWVLTGDRPAPGKVITLNTLSHLMIRGPTNHGIKFVEGVDNNQFYHVVIQGSSTTLIGVEYNTQTPGSDEEVYENNFYGLTIDVEGVGGKGVVVNNTATASSFILLKTAGAEDPGVPEINAGGKLTYWNLEKGSGRLINGSLELTDAGPAAPSAAVDINRVYKNTIVKAFGVASYSGGVPTLVGNFNVSGITDEAVGDITFTFDQALAANTYPGVASARLAAAFANATIEVQATGTFRVNVRNAAGALIDPSLVNFSIPGGL